MNAVQTNMLSKILHSDILQHFLKKKMILKIPTFLLQIKFVANLYGVELDLRMCKNSNN